MLVGHVATGLLLKRLHPRLPLGAAVAAALLADLLAFALIIAGVEQVHFGTARGAGHYFTGVNIAYSHSLAGGVALGLLLGLIVRALGRDTRAAWLLGAGVLSHWPLDVLSHRPDMPLAPGLPWAFGLGLWTSVPATLLVEGGLWALALALYVRGSRARSRGSLFAFWSGAALATLIWFGNIAGPPPANPATAPMASLVVFMLVVGWAYWIDRRGAFRTALRDTGSETVRAEVG
jgi:hypothetical protein